MNATILLWALAIIFAISIIGQLIWLGTDKFPARTRFLTVWDLVTNSVMFAWIVFALITK